MVLINIFNIVITFNYSNNNKHIFCNNNFTFYVNYAYKNIKYLYRHECMYHEKARISTKPVVEAISKWFSMKFHLCSFFSSSINITALKIIRDRASWSSSSVSGLRRIEKLPRWKTTDLSIEGSDLHRFLSFNSCPLSRVSFSYSVRFDAVFVQGWIRGNIIRSIGR